ncbi:DUF4331 family protein [Segetibacter aerophilus]|uniref:Secretion system C-terminal sorting domain-containing protein n=1 Tax=Segetibacter aerophilus TaxID=670293 RepID=A0A512BBX5_9BACT|nr:DUF4331 family protein [Segetibacter aerophilus]GEO09466.1 hypothetical protein SAE01_19620 [Segetibacter aerophilus]
MKKFLKLCAATLVCLAFNQTLVIASSHREAPLIAYDPLADNTDVYAFRSPTNPDNVVLIANYIPFEHPAGGPNYYTFGQNIRYEIHVKNKTTTTGDDITYRFTFQQVNEDPTTFFKIRLGKENLKTTYTLDRSVNGGTFNAIVTNGIVPPPNIGPRSIDNPTVGLGKSYDAVMQSAIATATTGEKVFAGQIDDPFFVDLGGIFDLANVRNPGRDGLAKFNVHSLVIEVPISTLQKNNLPVSQAANILDPNYVIGVWASASRREITTFEPTTGQQTPYGEWIQVSRLGMPLTNEVIVPIGAKDKWNSVASNSADEGQFATYFKNPELALYMDDSKFGGSVPFLTSLRIQANSLGAFDFRNGRPGLFPVRGTPGVAGTAFAESANGGFAELLLPDNMSPRAVDLLPIFLTGVPNVRPYQLATGKGGDPLATGKPFINNFLPTIGDMLRLNMAVPVTPRNSADFNSLGLIQAAVLGLTDPRFNGNANLEFIPNMDGFPNGRRLEDDVTRIELQAVSGVVLAAIGLPYENADQLGKTLGFKAGPTQNDTAFRTVYPYVQGPWRGFTGAQYVGPRSEQTLPLGFLALNAEKAGKEVNLKWHVTNEINNNHFEVEYSTDGSKFVEVGRVRSTNGATSIYEFVHATPSLNTINYYRIKQVDNDGRFSYSPLKSIKFDFDNVVQILPNPASNFIKVYTKMTGVTANLFDGSGKKLASQIVTNGMTQFNISHLPKGNYLIISESNGVRIDTRKIIKQ